MGLDNMPHAYPCKEQGTAVIEKKTHTWEDENGNTQSENSYPVDCDKTIEAGGCPDDKVLFGRDRMPSALGTAGTLELERPRSMS